MKITDIRIQHYAIPLDPPYRAAWDHQPRPRLGATIVEVFTDEGLVGIGSGDAMTGFEDYKHLFVGQDPFAIERHSLVLETIAFHGARHWPFENALWDLMAKAAGQAWRMPGDTRPAWSRKTAWMVASELDLQPPHLGQRHRPAGQPAPGCRPGRLPLY